MPPENSARKLTVPPENRARSKWTAPPETSAPAKSSFRAFYGFEAFYCLPGAEGAHEKGGIEGEIGRFRRRWFVPVPQAGSLAELNARLAEADAAEDARHVAGRAASIGEDFAAERGLLLPLPPEPFDHRHAASGRGWTGMPGSAWGSAGIRCRPG